MTDGRTDGQTDRRTENTICRAAWSQLKIIMARISLPDHRLQKFLRYFFSCTYNFDTSELKNNVNIISNLNRILYLVDKIFHDDGRISSVIFLSYIFYNNI